LTVRLGTVFQIETRSDFSNFVIRHILGEAYAIDVSCTCLISLIQISGGFRGKAPPDPIPNSEVKLAIADGTARVTVWESRTLPDYFWKSPSTCVSMLAGFSVF
jgi:hypothetical protein